MFWACGVTPQAVIAAARPALCITHAPGPMLVTDLRTTGSQSSERDPVCSINPIVNEQEDQHDEAKRESWPQMGRPWGDRGGHRGGRAGRGMAAPAGVAAQDLPKTQLQVVGASISSLPQYKDFEMPFWTKELPEKSGGAITAEIKGFNEMGLKGPEVLRLMGHGRDGDRRHRDRATSPPTTRPTRCSTWPGLLPDIATARKVTDACKPVYDKLYREKFGVELLGFGTYPAQVLYLQRRDQGPGRRQGQEGARRQRRSQSELSPALGGTPVTLAFGEVVPALQNKTVDCGITGTLSGNSAKWNEVTTHLLALPLSWGQIGYAANAKTWAGVRPEGAHLPRGRDQDLEKARLGGGRQLHRSRATSATPAPTRATSAPRAR